MEQSDWQVAVCQMKVGWRLVSLENGKWFVTTTGVGMKLEWCVDNLDTAHKVCLSINLINADRI